MCRVLSISILTADLRSGVRGNWWKFYTERFSDIGTFKDYKYHIELDPKVKISCAPSYKKSFIFVAMWHYFQVYSRSERSRCKGSEWQDRNQGLDVTIHDITTSLNHVQVWNYTEIIFRRSGFTTADARLAWPHKTAARSTQTILAIKRWFVHRSLPCYISR